MQLEANETAPDKFKQFLDKWNVKDKFILVTESFGLYA